MSPVVPRRAPSFVPTEPMRPLTVPPGAFMPPTPVDISPVISVFSKLVAEHRQKADETALIGADAQLAQLSNSLLYDPHSGALSRRGLAAQAAHDPTVDAWKKGVSEIEQGLSPNQRDAFKQRATVRASEFDRVIMDHVMRETDTAARDAAAANLDGERSAILHNYGDPGRIASGVEHQKAVLTLTGNNLGWSPEVTRQRIAEEVSRIHTGVLTLMIAKGNDLAASKYFQEHLGVLEPGAIEELQKHIDLASVRGESQRQSDSILASTATLGGALKEVAKIEDPQLRDATQERVSRQYELRAADQRAQRDESFQRAGQVLEQTHDMNKIAPADWLKLSVGDRETLKNRDDQIRYPRRDTNPDLYFSLMNMAGLNEASRQQFQSLNLAQYRDQLSPAHLDQLVRLQRSSNVRTLDAAQRDAKKAQAAAQKRAQTALFLQQHGLTLPPSAPGAPLRTPAGGTTPPASTGDINLGSPASPNGTLRPYVSPADREHAKRDPKFRAYLLHMGAQL